MGTSTVTRKYPANVYAAHVPPAVPSPAPALSALTPHQLGPRLSLTTPRPGPDLGSTRDYTVFDIADAVVTVTAPPDNRARDLDSEERFNEALEELLGDYEDYSQEQGSNAEQEVEILSEIIGKTVNEPSLN